MLDDFLRTMDLITKLVAERSRRSADDPPVRTLAGAIIGISIPAWLDRDGASHSGDYLAAIDEGLAQLETGFRP
jgi:hypothetical protein